MLGSRPRMPKRARYPLFLLGLVTIILGGLATYWRGSLGAEVVDVTVGFLLVVAAVLVK